MAQAPEVFVSVHLAKIPGTSLIRRLSWYLFNMLVSITVSSCAHDELDRDRYLPRDFAERPSVEQFIIIDEPRPEKATPPTEQAYRAIIIPTAAVGASALRKTFPRVISFTLPKQKAGTDFSGEIGEAADDPDDTCRSLVTRVFNGQLAPFQKSIIDASAAAAAAEKPKHRLMCDAALKQEIHPPEKPVKGELLTFLASLPASSYIPSCGHRASRWQTLASTCY